MRARPQAVRRREIVQSETYSIDIVYVCVKCGQRASDNITDEKKGSEKPLCGQREFCDALETALVVCK